MISEPELEGEWEQDRAQEPARPDPPEAAVRGQRAPWLWGLAGVVLASAVWTTVPALQERSSAAPRIEYRHTENLCKDARLNTLLKVTAPSMSDHPTHRESPALDWSHCEYFTEWVEGGTSYQMQTMVELHKKTDPQAEFGTGPGSFMDALQAPADVEQVPGLGEKALMTTHFAGAGAGPRLQVLDGGAVFTLSVGWLGDTDGAPQPDEDAVKTAMIEDMRVLMGRLRK
ncbi:hypothetical protein AB0953_08630 [Streptomyces sp. NPDC046866]|uniref:hypothetical protein n=1 Tax=Streptomyces sp. NPDC046866 TaxID=3154921 RepID=UPI00345426D0